MPIIVLLLLSYGSWSPPTEAGDVFTPGQRVNKTFKEFAEPFLVNHCADCHGETTKEGGLSLHDIGPVTEVNADKWQFVWAQVTLRELPPRDESHLPMVERLRFSEWIVGELRRVKAAAGGFHLDQDPSKGNFLDHDLLFGPLPEGIRLVPTSWPARLWRVTPQEHITRLNELINLEPAYDPERPGLRVHGDAVPVNHIRSGCRHR